MKHLEQLSPSEINQKLDRLDKQRNECIDELILAGRGSEPHLEIMKKLDPLSLKYQKISNQINILKNEIYRRYGSGLYRCPVMKRKTY